MRIVISHLALTRRRGDAYDVRLAEPLAVALLIVCIVAPIAIYQPHVLARDPWLPVVAFVLLFPSVRLSVSRDGVAFSRCLGVIPFRRRRLAPGGVFECAASDDGGLAWFVEYRGSTEEIWCLFPARFAAMMNRETATLTEEKAS